VFWSTIQAVKIKHDFNWSTSPAVEKLRFNVRPSPIRLHIFFCLGDKLISRIRTFVSFCLVCTKKRASCLKSKNAQNVSKLYQSIAWGAGQLQDTDFV